MSSRGTTLNRFAVTVTILAIVGIGTASSFGAVNVGVQLVSQLGGSGYCIATTGTRAVVGEGGGVVVLDLADPSAPLRKGKVLLPTSFFFVRSVDIGDATTAYAVANDPWLNMLDISNQDHPSLQDRHALPGFGTSVKVRGQYVYAAAARTIEVGAETTSVVTAFAADGGTLAKTGEVEVDFLISDMTFWKNYLIVAGNHKMGLIDLTTPSTPIFVWDWFAQIEITSITAGPGDIVFASSPQFGLASYDFTDPMNPLGPLDILGPPVVSPLIGVVFDCHLQGNYVYVASGVTGLTIADGSDPYSLAWAGDALTSGVGSAATVNGAWAYTSSEDGGASAINVTDPNNPFVSGGYEVPGISTGIESTIDLRASVSTGWGGYYLLDFHTTDPATIVSHFLDRTLHIPPFYEDVALFENYAVLSNTGVGEGNIVLLSLADPTSPTLAGYCNLLVGDTAQRIVVDGHYLYAPERTTGLNIIDLLDPAHPQPVGFVPTGQFNVSVSARGNTAYLGRDDSDQMIVDVTDKANPTIVGTFNTAPDETAKSQLLTGNTLILGLSGGVQFWDVTNPTTPTLVSRIPLADADQTAFSLAMPNPNLLFVGVAKYSDSSGAAVDVYDVTDITAPVRIGHFGGMPMPAYGMSAPSGLVRNGVVEPYVYCATWFGGVYVLKYVPETDLSIMKVPSVEPATYMQPFSYTIDVRNNGPIASTEVTVSDILPPILTYVGADPLPSLIEEGTTVTFQLGTLQPAETTQIVITVLPNDIGVASNTAVVTAGADPDETNNSVTFNSTVIKPNGPDFTGTWLNARRSMTRGGQTMLSGRFLEQNIGDQKGGRTRVLFYASNKPALDDSAIFCGQTTRAPLRSGAGSIIQFRYRLGPAPRLDDYTRMYMIAVVEPLAIPGDVYPPNNTVPFGPIP